ncbi:hypothetical protein Ocin01_17327 [Orchesella cincta]|uniref:Uncharacterized protein n=1 Tax=Orchesella cincta TaxID=48709 RepID=A0A1D2M8P8_ORCCI|nr:hypothetical protein Ocin01_17327 [Orchesella cincta]
MRPTTSTTGKQISCDYVVQLRRKLTKMANLNGAKRVKVFKSSLGADDGHAHQDNSEQFHKITEGADTQDVLTSGKTLFNLFPEIWDEILAYLSASDFHSLINSSQFINQLLEEKKTTSLLPLVLSILMEYIPFSSLLQLRGVNRAAKSLISGALESHSSSLDGYWTSTYKGSSGGRHPLHVNESRIQFTSLRLSQNAYFNPPQLLSRFLNRHKLERRGDPATPFLTRSITLPVTVHDDIPFQEQKTLRLELMTKFGHQLRHLRSHVGTCFIEPNELNHAALIVEFISLLHRIPNLRILTLLGGNRFQPGAVAGLRRISPIPDLPHLELLDFENFTFNSGLPHEDDVDPEEALDIGCSLNTDPS